ncbi:serine hydrolase domain-containing protein [Sciscionella marina]|uniref:serine hydrolase domain-containing protein n=1 Tax=Sciscionella marina TaxID=508770 RepID=UPI00036AB722|nr:serine hydrolase [Sciscionella marina]
MFDRLLRAAVGAAAMVLVISGTALATPARSGTEQCALPAAGAKFPTADPERVALDPRAVHEAIGYAATHLRLSVKIFRNNCQVGAGPLDAVTDKIPWNIWSSTKAVVSMLTGIAADRGALALDDPIGRYLPHGTGWGDAAHRAITVRQLLTQTSGLRQAIVSEAGTLGADSHIAREALSQPLEHEPGTHFAYGQRDPDLLAYVVQRAVGQDLQGFAQRFLFDPLGIPRSSYFWLRDRTGNTYGYANLFIPPAQYAKLGLLMQNDGIWAGRRVLSTGYVHQVGMPGDTNGCYGLLFWSNRGNSCTSADIPSAQTVGHRMIPSAPRDLYAMVGFLQQNNFVIPSLNMTVSWTGILGDTAPNLGSLISANLGASDLYYNFFRILMRGVTDRHIPDPGPFRTPPFSFDVNPIHYADPRVLLHDLAPGRSCNILVCGGTIPLKGLAQNVEAIARTLLSAPA